MIFMHNKLPLCFSNAIWVHYLSFLGDEQGQESVNKLLALFGRDINWVQNSKLWHNADDHEIFLKILVSFFGNSTDIPYLMALSAFTEKRSQIFTSMLGLFVSPDKLFNKLPDVVKRMNHYNSYSFKLQKERLAYGRGRLIQTYGDLTREKLNSFLCSASRGSIEGTLKFFGYKIIELQEIQCVKKGHAQCEYQIGWMKRSSFLNLLKFTLISSAFFLLSYFLIENRFLLISLLSVVGSLAVIMMINSFLRKKAFLEIYNYQQTLYEDQKEIAEQIELLNKKIIGYQRKITEALELASFGENSIHFLKEATNVIQLLRHYSNELNSEIAEGSEAVDGVSKREKLVTYGVAIDKATSKVENLLTVFRNKLR